MATMYNGKAFSPPTVLSDSISANATIIPVEDISVFPPAPNYATIGIDETGETILYTAKTATSLSGCTRGVEGTAKAWAAGESIGRNFTAKDHNDLISNLKDVMAPDYTEAEALSGLESGETLVKAFGKLKKAIIDLIAHIANKSNPHGVTAAQAGAVPTSRTVNNKALSSNISLTASDVGADASGTAAAAVSSHDSNTGAHSTQFAGKQNKIAASGLLKGNGEGAVSSAVENEDYAPPGVQYPATIVPITSNATLGSAHAGKFILAGSSSAITLTLPSSGMTPPDELEIYNGGTANVTITGALRLGSVASSAKSIVLSEGNGVTVKMIAASGAGMWLVIGTFKEA